jgi:hypothetical protein
VTPGQPLAASCMRFGALGERGYSGTHRNGRSHDPAAGRGVPGSGNPKTAGCGTVGPTVGLSNRRGHGNGLGNRGLLRERFHPLRHALLHLRGIRAAASAATTATPATAGIPQSRAVRAVACSPILQDRVTPRPIWPSRADKGAGGRAARSRIEAARRPARRSVCECIHAHAAKLASGNPQGPSGYQEGFTYPL